MMKILIGTPIHQDKDHCLEKWLENVSRLKYPTDLLMVDSSPGLEYLTRAKTYCRKYDIANYRLKHLDVNQAQPAAEMVGRSWEIIRQYLLSHHYDAWFALECGQLVSANTLNELVRLIQTCDFSIVHHNFGAKTIPIELTASLNCSLVKRECLEKFGFLLEYPDMPDKWHGGDAWFKKQVLDHGGSYADVYGAIAPLPRRRRQYMKILVGTAIHQTKDYAMARWVANLSRLKYPADIFLVDNSPDLTYVATVKGYLKQHGIKKYAIDHININQQLHSDVRVEMSQEVIRQKVLFGNYDAWFSWECDQIIPPNALDKLVQMMRAGNFMMVNHNGWVRGHPGHTNTDFGVSLVHRQALSQHSFLLQTGTNPDMPTTWEPGEAWFKKAVLRHGGSALEVDGAIKPIYHLDQ